VGDVEIIRAEFLEPFALRKGPACVFVIVVYRDLAGVLRKRHGQFSRGIDVTKQYIRNRIPGLTSCKPYIEDRRDIFRLPPEGQWPTREEDDDDRFSGFR